MNVHRHALHRMASEALAQDPLDLEWRGPAADVDVVRAPDDPGLFVWPLGRDGSPAGDPVLFIDAEGVTP